MHRLALFTAIAVAGCYTHERDPDASTALDASIPPDAVALDAVAPDAASPDAFVAIDAAVEVDAAIDVDAASSCANVRADDWITPTVVAVGEPIPVLMRSDFSSGCGCTPASVLADPAGPVATFLACDCSNADPCVDPGYDTTFIASASTIPGEQRQFYHPYPGGRVIIDVVDPASCTTGPLTFSAITLVAPDGAHIVAPSDRHAWVHVRGTSIRCCDSPQPLVSAVATGASITLSGMDCRPDPCDCVGGPRDFETDVHLGALAPGHYDVRAGTASLGVDLP